MLYRSKNWLFTQYSIKQCCLCICKPIIKRPDINTNDVITLKKNGYSLSAIAKTLNCNRDTVKHRLQNAKQ